MRSDLETIVARLAEKASALDAQAAKYRHAITVLEELEGDSSHKAPAVKPPAPTVYVTVNKTPEQTIAFNRPSSPGAVAAQASAEATGRTCPECGHKGLRKAPGPGQKGKLLQHRSPECRLLCKGGKVAGAAKEDLAAGIHSLENCPKCKKARVSYV